MAAGAEIGIFSLSTAMLPSGRVVAQAKRRPDRMGRKRCGLFGRRVHHQNEFAVLQRLNREFSLPTFRRHSARE
jgi:hypothetical protein